MRKDLFDQLVQSVAEMKAIQAGQRTPSRVTRVEEVLNNATPDVTALPSSATSGVGRER